MSKINPKFDTHRADTLNPNNDAYWQSKGFKKRPINWQKKLKIMKVNGQGNVIFRMMGEIQ